jgi:MFS family permease
VSTHLVLFSVAALLGGVMAGGQLFVLIAIVPVKKTWDDALAVPLHQRILAVTADHLLRPFAGAALTLTIVGIIADHGIKGWTGVGAIVAIVGILGVMIVSFRVQFPLNKQILELKPGEAYRPLGERWDRGHLIRTASGTLAFVGMLLAAVASNH